MADRVWIVSELYFPETTSTGHFLTGIAEGLAARYDVNVICSQPTYSARGTRAPVSEIKAGVNIFRAYSPLLDKNVLVFRLLNLFFFSWSVFWCLLWRLRSTDVVIVVTNPPTLPYVVAVACFARRAKCVLLVHDVYPEVLIATGVIRDGSIWASLLKRLSRKLYESMSAVVVIGGDMERLVRGILDGHDQRIELIPNWADLEEIQPRSRAGNRLLQTLGITDEFVVQYSGNMGRTHGLEYILSAASTLTDKTKIKFLMIGEGARRDWLTAQVTQLRLANVVVLPLQDRKYLCDSLNSADLSIISFLPGMSGISVPSRMYNIFAAGKPVIAVTEEDSELAAVVRRERIGWVVSPRNPELLSKVIQEASENKQQLADMGKRARLVAESTYSLQKVLEKYSGLIEVVRLDSSRNIYTTRSSS